MKSKYEKNKRIQMGEVIYIHMIILYLHNIQLQDTGEIK